MKTKEIDSINKEILFSKYISTGKCGICFKKDKDKDKDKLIKIFYNYYFNTKDMTDFLNKLENFKNDTYVIPNELLVKDNKLIGYTEDYINSKCLKNINGSIYRIFNGFDKLIKDTKEISDKGLVLKDIHYKNILFNDEYHIIDLDNCYIEENPTINIFNHNMNIIMESILFSIFDINLCNVFNFYNYDYTKLRQMKSSNYNYFYYLIEELVKNTKSEDIKLIKKRTGYESTYNSYLKPF